MLACMYRRTFENTIFTRWDPLIDIVKAAPAKGTRQASEASPIKPLKTSHRSRFRRVTVEVQYRGGAEASWIIWKGRSCWRFPGHMCLHDVLARVVG